MFNDLGHIPGEIQMTPNPSLQGQQKPMLFYCRPCIFLNTYMDVILIHRWRWFWKDEHGMWAEYGKQVIELNILLKNNSVSNE
jgi:hypothetical protein